MEYSVDLKTGQMTGNAEYGSFMSNAKSPTFHRDRYRHMLKQLKFYLKNNTSSNPKKLKLDIEGYKEILATNSEEICERFSALKVKAIEDGSFVSKSNMDIVMHMKRNGMWEKGDG